MIENVLNKVLGEAAQGPWALLDCPLHSNVGDSAIWLGSLAILGPRFGQSPRAVTRFARFPQNLDHNMPDGPIFFLGGGNFGDIWPRYWENRVAVLRQFRVRKIVQLPQSIHFKDLNGAPLAQTKKAIAGHPDFTLMVRDQTSLEFAQDHFECPTYLCPDFATGLGQLNADKPPSVPILGLMRSDIEKRNSAGETAQQTQGIKIVDWVDADRHPLSDRIVPKLTQLVPRLHGPLMKPLFASFQRQVKRNLERGVDILGQGDVIVTDRLHGHILCSLMGKRHVLLDNANGKVLRYVKAWPNPNLTTLASSIDEAFEIAKSLN